MLAPALWGLMELNGKRPDAFVLVAFPGLWVFLTGALSLGAMKLEQYRTLGMRVIALGQIVGMSLLVILTVGMIVMRTRIHFEYSLVPLGIGQTIVAVGLNIRRWESEALPMVSLDEYDDFD